MQRRSRPEVETSLQCRSTRLESRMEKEIWCPTGRTMVPPPAPSPVLWLVDRRRADGLAVSSGAPFITGLFPVTLSRP